MRGTIRLENLGVRFGRTVALDGIDARFEPGSMTAVVGQNGAGKSTLLRAIMGLVRLSNGAIHFDDLHRRDIAYLPQAQEIDRSFPIDVTDFVSLGAWPRIGLGRGLSGAERSRLTETIERVGLAEHRHASIGWLSGGQFQRALFARLILQDAPVVLLDEPFAALDTQTTNVLAAWLQEWHAQGRTIVAVLHDMHLVEREFERTMLLEHRLLAHGPSAGVLAQARGGARREPRLVAA